MPFRVTTQKAENLSLLPALTVDGYMTCSIFRGAINAQIFEEFIDRDVPPLCYRYRGSKSVIVMDNAGIHIPEVRSGSIILTFSRIFKLSLMKRDAGLNFYLLTHQTSTRSNIHSLLSNVH